MFSYWYNNNTPKLSTHHSVQHSVADSKEIDTILERSLDNILDHSLYDVQSPPSIAQQLQELITKTKLLENSLQSYDERERQQTYELTILRTEVEELKKVVSSVVQSTTEIAKVHTNKILTIETSLLRTVSDLDRTKNLMIRKHISFPFMPTTSGNILSSSSTCSCTNICTCKHIL